jgi:hypothetical protein
MMRKGFMRIISMALICCLVLAGCGSAQAQDSGNKAAQEASQAEQETPEVGSTVQETPEATEPEAETPEAAQPEAMQQEAEGEETMSAGTHTTQEIESSESEEEQAMLQMTIGETPVEVKWEDNESVEALGQLCQNGPLTMQMSMYGGFEQVGSIGQRLPRNDSQTTTQSGDIVLYAGDQIVVFYGSNSWAYTRLGHVTNKSDEEMAQLLGNGDVQITIEMK